MTITDLKAIADRLAAERGIDLRHDQLQAGELPKYQCTKDQPTGGLGNVETIGAHVHVELVAGLLDADAIAQFITDEPTHKHYRLPFRASGGDVVEWGLAAMS